jgi:dephospho-CoA kinase
MVVIGLTGNLGAGKTTVAQMFERLGAEIIDADEIAHELLVEHGPCRKKICEIFPCVVGADGVIDRKKLAGEVFKDEKKLKDLEDILHPAVGKRIKQVLQFLRLQKKVEVVVLDIPLLFEAGIDHQTDVVIVVKADREQQIGRVVKARGMTRSAAVARLRRQMPQKEKLKRADFILDNRFSKAETRTQVRQIWEGLVRV